MRFAGARKVVWAAPAAGLGAVGLPIAIIIPNFYVENVGVSASVAALVFLLMRIWDGVTDPLMGYMSDRLRPPFGRRRFWVLLSVPLLCAALWMLFVPPAWADGWYLAVSLLLFYIGLTALQVNHLSWGAELETSPNDRTKLMGLYELLVIAGLVAILGLLAWLETGLSAEEIANRRPQTLAVLAIVLAAAFVLTCAPALGILPEGRVEATVSFSLRQVMGVLVGNRRVLKVLIANIAYRAASGVTGTLFLWYFALRMQMGSLASLVLATYFVIGLLALPGWVALAARFGRTRVFVVAMVVGAAAMVPMVAIVPDGGNIVTIGGVRVGASQLLVVLLTLIVGSTYGVAPFISRAIISDLAEEERLSTGRLVTGLYFAVLTFCEKAGLAFAVGFSLAMLDIIGFEPGRGALPVTEGTAALAILYSLPAAALLLAAAIAMWSFSKEPERASNFR